MVAIFVLAPLPIQGRRLRALSPPPSPCGSSPSHPAPFIIPSVHSALPSSPTPFLSSLSRLHSLALSLFLRPLSPLYPKNRTNPFRSFSSVFPLQPTLGAYGATHTIAFQLFYSLLPPTFESSPRGGFFASLCLLLCNYPPFLPSPCFSSSLSLPPPFAADPPSRPQCRRTRRSPKKKREEKPAQVRSSTLSCARRSMDLCSFRDSCDRPNDPNISAAAATAARRAAPRVIYASTSIGVDEVERPSRTREGEGERKRKRENKRSDRAQAGLTLHSSRLDFRL